MLHLRVLAVVADLIGSLPGLAPELVRGGVLRELLCLVRHPLLEYRNNGCNDKILEDHTIYMMQMVNVLRACTKQLPQVLPRLALAAVQLCMRCPLLC